MRIYFGVYALLIAIAGCGQNGKSVEQAGDTTLREKTPVAATSDTLCYERYSGSRNQDTASVSLVINGNKVTGRYANIPFEKDARSGTLNGTRSGDTIKGTWRFQQEGVSDSLPVEFKLNSDHLLQKATSFDVNTGRETLTDTASFSLKFARVDCKAVNNRIR